MLHPQKYALLSEENVIANSLFKTGSFLNKNI